MEPIWPLRGRSGPPPGCWCWREFVYGAVWARVALYTGPRHVQGLRGVVKAGYSRLGGSMGHGAFMATVRQARASSRVMVLARVRSWGTLDQGSSSQRAKSRARPRGESGLFEVVRHRAWCLHGHCEADPGRFQERVLAGVRLWVTMG